VSQSRQRGKDKDEHVWFHPSNCGLTIVLFSLFVVFLVGQSLTGWHGYNSTRQSFNQGTLNYLEYLGTGSFLNGAFSNWQAAIMELAALIILTSFVHQLGASDSRLPEQQRYEMLRGQGRARITNAGQKAGSDRPKIIKKRGIVRWLYENSLLGAFLLLFLCAFTLHILSGAKLYNSQLIQEGKSTVSVLHYFISTQFWFQTFSTWEAEYLAIGLFTVLTIFLRQKGSAESKPLDATREQTGAE
jgi:hypothetical protein